MPMIIVLCLTPAAAQAEPEAEAVVVYHSGLSTVVIRNGGRAAALMTCAAGDLRRMQARLPASLDVYTRAHSIDTLRVTTADIVLGPFERRGDSLFINQARYALKDLERGDCYKIY